jgi:hypothetical protein
MVYAISRAQKTTEIRGLMDVIYVTSRPMLPYLDIHHSISNNLCPTFPQLYKPRP